MTQSYYGAHAAQKTNESEELTRVTVGQDSLCLSCRWTHRPQNFLTCCCFNPNHPFKKNRKDVQAATITLYFLLLHNALVSDSVEPIRPRCDVWAGSRHERWKGSSGGPEAGGSILLSILQIPQHRRMRRKHWGISVAYFHTFAFFFFSKSDSRRQTVGYKHTHQACSPSQKVYILMVIQTWQGCAFPVQCVRFCFLNLSTRTQSARWLYLKGQVAKLHHLTYPGHFCYLIWDDLPITTRLGR